MFHKRDRLSRASFPTALKEGRRLSSANFSVVVSSTAQGYAVVVSKKVARLSVTRHRLKRRVLAALRSFSSPPPSLIVFPRASAISLTYSATRAELAGLLSNIR